MNKATFFYSRIKTQFRYFVWARIKHAYPINVDRNKAIFIHIPKTAGTSIYNLIGHTYIGHVPYSWYKNRSLEKFNDYFKFAVVRNPWDRLLSTYFYLKKGGSNDMDKYWGKKNISHFSNFDEFVKNWVNTKNVNSWMHFVPQYSYIYDDTDELQVDYLARFENLSNDFLTISSYLGIEKKLPHVNASQKRSSYKSYYSEESRAIVADVYRKDIELLNYEYE